ncbi:MAG: hypothetical protein ACT4P1_16985 [Sporichthyaceae bacterium]
MPDPKECDYATFGRQLFTELITPERVVTAVKALAGEQFSFGPNPVGPGKLARLTVTGRLEQPTARRRGTEPLQFRLTLPAEVDLTVDVGGQASRFHSSVVVVLNVTVRAALPLALVFDVAPVDPEDITVTLAGDGLRANLLRTMAGMDDEVHRYVAKFIARELASARLREATTIDVAAIVESGFAARFAVRRGA